MKKCILFIALLVFVGVGCKKKPHDPEIILNDSALTIPGIENTVPYSIHSNTDWTVTSSETWLTVNPASGKGDATISFISEKTPKTLTSRTCTLTVSGTGVTSQTIIVTQDRFYNPIFSVSSPGPFDVGAIIKIDPNTGKTIQTISMPTDPYFEDGLAFDGKMLYYINGRTDGVGINKIIQIDPSLVEPNKIFSTVLPLGIDALGINKKNLFALDFHSPQLIFLIDIDTQNIIDTIVPAFPTAIGGMTFGGSRGTIFVSSFMLNTQTDFKIYELNASTGAVLNFFAVPIKPFGLAYSESSDVLYMSAGDGFDPQKSIYIIDPNTGHILKQFSGSSAALAADESSL